jgi:transcription factor IIIB subunit 2
VWCFLLFCLPPQPSLSSSLGEAYGPNAASPIRSTFVLAPPRLRKCPKLRRSDSLTLLLHSLSLNHTLLRAGTMPGPINTGRRPRERLSSINDPRSKHTYTAKRSSPAAPAPTVQAPVATCCDTPNISTDESGTICYSCGSLLNASSLSAEVTFGENAAGAAVVQGGFVGENQRYANTMGANVRGIISIESRVLTQKRGTDEIQQLGSALGLSNDVKAMAGRMYGLALNHNFVQGRRVRNVAAVALYLAARKQPENTLMLMDLSERVMCNVWALGDTYKQFCKTIMDSDPGELVGNRTVQEIEPLMLKFCRKLEFGTDSHRVANDACRILRRMKRDWMVQGRNPAGLCGACIILAARMNNFRRTVREVVYVVKVADTTINARLHEYKRTPSSALTVDQFRKYGQQLKVKTLPPAIYKRAEKEQRAEERKRKAVAELGADVEAEDGHEDDEATELSSHTGPSKSMARSTRTTKKRRLDKGKAKAILFQTENGDSTEEPAVPDVEALAGDSEAALDALAQANGLDAMEADEDEVVVPKKRGRPPKKAEPIIIPDEELEIEAEIEHEITETVTNWSATFQEFVTNENHALFIRTGDRARELAQLHMPNANINDDDLLEDEFEDDPDVSNAIIHDEAEIRFRERTWITDNEDWLRKQQQKMLAKALEEAKGEPPKVKHRRKVNRMGDGTVLEGETGMSAAAATQKMISKRAKHFSNAIDYEKLKELFPETHTPQGSGAGASPAASAGQQEPVPAPASTHVEVPVGDEDAEGEYEEEDEQQTYHEEEDLEYYSDEDEGIRPEDLMEDY